jgi:transposase InsO family protein
MDVTMLPERLFKFVVTDENEKRKIISSHHDSPLAGHLGKRGTAELIERSYTWHGLRDQVDHYVEECDLCQRTKARNHPADATLHPHKTPNQPWEEISVDFMGPFTMSGNFDFITVFVDKLTKMVHYVPCNSDITARKFAKIFLDTVVRAHGLPKKVISDRGTQFNSSFTRELFSILGIKANMSTAYHPQTDGQTERVNRDLNQYLRLFVSYRQDDWARWLSLAEIVYNNHAHSSIGMTPFFANYGKHPAFGPINAGLGKNPMGQEFGKTMEMVWEQAKDSLNKASEVMKRKYDGKRKSPSFKIGDMVLLDGTNINTTRPVKKWSERRYGPFKITEKIGEGAWKLHLPKGWKKIHPVFNESLLTLYKGEMDATRPPAELVDDELEYEVEKILDRKEVRGHPQFLVKWKGYPMEESTWEPRKNLENAKEMMIAEGWWDA